jgi:tetratricopeptide (TPR) repeat protein
MSSPDPPALEDAIEDLRRRLVRHPPERYPIQHATAQFHLGTALAQTNELEAAQRALKTAAALFAEAGLAVEAAKAANGLGAVLRARGDLRRAARAFADAAEAFRGAARDLEQGAAHHNLGLVQKAMGHGNAALSNFSRARLLLDEQAAPRQAAAAAREKGVALLEAGHPRAAAAELEDSMRLFEESGDLAGLADAANSHGLALLAAGDTGTAIESFKRSAAASPPGIRPRDFAVAKANLASAYERRGEVPRARTSALQAMAVSELPKAVAAQAQGVLRKMGRRPGDLFSVLQAEDRELWPAIVRDELRRWAADTEENRAAEAKEWVRLQAHGPEAAADMVEALVGGLLEMPPDDLVLIVRSALLAAAELPPHQAETWRAEVDRIFARFPVPQWQRLQHLFAAVSSDLGVEGTWS